MKENNYPPILYVVTNDTGKAGPFTHHLTLREWVRKQILDKGLVANGSVYSIKIKDEDGNFVETII